MAVPGSLIGNGSTGLSASLEFFADTLQGSLLLAYGKDTNRAASHSAAGLPLAERFFGRSCKSADEENGGKD